MALHRKVAQEQSKPPPSPPPTSLIAAEVVVVPSGAVVVYTQLSPAVACRRGLPRLIFVASHSPRVCFPTIFRAFFFLLSVRFFLFFSPYRSKTIKIRFHSGICEWRTSVNRGFRHNSITRLVGKSLWILLRDEITFTFTWRFSIGEITNLGIRREYTSFFH